MFDWWNPFRSSMEVSRESHTVDSDLSRDELLDILKNAELHIMAESEHSYEISYAPGRGLHPCPYRTLHILYSPKPDFRRRCNEAE